MAILIITPHFDLPFRLSGKAFAAVEQDTNEDVANCVECIVRTPVGTREDSPDFGIDDMQFNLMPLNIERIKSQIELLEPRARLTIEQHPDLVDTLVSTIKIGVDQ